MKYFVTILFCALISIGFSASSLTDDKGEAHTIATYRAVPGKQIELLKWFAKEDAVSKEAGLPIAKKIYIHSEGESWDFLLISDPRSEEQIKKWRTAAKKLGFPIGLKGAMEMRALFAEHSETIVSGPFYADEILEKLGEK